MLRSILVRAILVRASLLSVASLCAAMPACGDDLWVTYDGGDGPGKGKHIVLVSGDEEYRSEEALPQLGKILSVRHGFKCTVLFAIDPESGTIDPNHTRNIPGLEALASADLMIIATRFRNLPDEQMKHIADYIESGRPIIGMRTATHAFKLDDSSAYRKYSFNSSEWDGGFGRQVLGETWISHHGRHGGEATRGIVAEDAKEHPIARGLKDVFGPTDVYGVRLPLPGDSKPIVLGEVVKGMQPTDAAVEGKKNDPMMPVAWTKSYKAANGKTARVFTTTMGASQDLLYEGTRRMLVNASLWCLGLEDKITAALDVGVVGEYETRPFKFDGSKKGVKPSAHRLQSAHRSPPASDARTRADSSGRR